MHGTGTVVSVFSVRSRAIGSVFDELVAFFRPTYAHVREEKQRLDLMREEEGDAGFHGRGDLGNNGPVPKALPCWCPCPRPRDRHHRRPRSGSLPLFSSQIRSHARSATGSRPSSYSM